MTTLQVILLSVYLVGFTAFLMLWLFEPVKQRKVLFFFMVTVWPVAVLFCLLFMVWSALSYHFRL